MEILDAYWPCSRRHRLRHHRRSVLLEFRTVFVFLSSGLLPKPRGRVSGEPCAHVIARTPHVRQNITEEKLLKKENITQKKNMKTNSRKKTMSLVIHNRHVETESTLSN